MRKRIFSLMFLLVALISLLLYINGVYYAITNHNIFAAFASLFIAWKMFPFIYDTAPKMLKMLVKGRV